MGSLTNTGAFWRRAFRRAERPATGELGDTQAPPRLFSLRLRLMLWMLAIVLVLQLMLSVVVVLYEQASMGRFFDDRLRARADSIASALRESDFHVSDDEMARIAKESLQFVLVERSLVTLYTGDGQVVASNMPALPAGAMRLDRAVLGTAPFIHRELVPGLRKDNDDEPECRVLIQRMRAVGGPEYVLLLATTDSYFEALSGLTLRVLFIADLIAALAAGVGGWIIAGIAVAPLDTLRHLAGSLLPEGLKEKVELTGTSREVAALEGALMNVRDKLQQALRGQDRFILNVSHELKTPIAVLLTEAQVMRPRNLPPEAGKFVDSVTEEMKRLGRTVESFLTLTKLRGGKSLEAPRRCTVNDFVMEAVSECGKMAKQYGVSLSPELSDSDPSLTVLGDPDLLRVMIDNLLRNAIRFSPQDCNVEVFVADAGAEAVIRVLDCGPGIPSDLLDTVFDRFVQAPEEIVRGRGTGLGLSIAQGIAELHGGRISVRNLEEKGCEFTVRLPVARGSLNGAASE